MDGLERLSRLTGSGSTISSLPFQPLAELALRDPNCSTSHSSAELLRHHLGSLRGFRVLR